MTLFASRRRTVAIITLILIATIAFLPMRLATSIIGLDRMGISARSVGGTIWSGRLEQVSAGGMALGTMDAGLDPLGLLLGRTRFAIARVDSADSPLSGQIEAGVARSAVTNLNGAVIGGTLGDIPIERITFENLSILFDDGRCQSASGQVRLTLGLRIAGLSLTNGLAGPARCDGNDLLLPLSGESGLERVTIRLAADRRYTVQFGVNSADPLLAAVLTAAGFSNRGGGYLRETRGQF